jgi:hypothetical protein
MAVLVKLRMAAVERGTTVPALVRELVTTGVAALAAESPPSRSPEELAAAIHQTAATQPVAYRRDWTAFTRWCARRVVDPTAADVDDLLRYVDELLDAGGSPRTAHRRVAGIASIYRAAGRVDDPTRDPELRRVLVEARRRQERSRPAHDERSDAA